MKNVVYCAVQIHGSLGVTLETPLAQLWMSLPNSGLADGSTEVHKVAVAKGFLKGVEPAPGVFPSEHLPPKLAAARARYADILNDPTQSA